MSGVRNYSPREVMRILRDNGWTVDRKKGDHYIYKKDGKHLTIKSTSENAMLIRRLFKENGIVVDD